jgi:uncharacterized membrane protein HdeD (DUF308 family)
VDDVQSMMEMPGDPALAGRWKWFVGLGIAILILGIIALMNVVDATLVTTIFVGWLLLLGGIAQIVAAFATNGTTGSRVLMGVLGVLYAIVGWDIIGNPLQGVVTLTVVISIVLIVEGIIRIFTAISGGTTHRGLVGFVGVVNLLLGLWLWSGIPVSGVAIGFFVGFELVLAGIVWIMGGWMARSLAPSPAAA